jgi:hypothetical protein
MSAMMSDPRRLTVDEGVDYINHTHGVPLSPEVLVDICESGWDPCRLDRQGDWTIDQDAVSGEDRARELVRRVARLASERQDAEDVMEEPPAGAEAEEDI